MVAIILLIATIRSGAQMPADFIHPVDTVYILATPVGGGAQIKSSSTGILQINLGAGKYAVVAYTGDAGTFSRYIRFSTAVAADIDTREAASLSLDLITSQCLVLVPRTATGVTSAPIINDGAGDRRAMFTGTNYYYAYVRWTKEGQKFTYNPTNAYNQDIAFIPQPGKVILWQPLDKTVNIETTGPFK